MGTPVFPERCEARLFWLYRVAPQPLARLSASNPRDLLLDEAAAESAGANLMALQERLDVIWQANANYSHVNMDV